MNLTIGLFVTPDAGDPERTLALIEAADAGGVDLVAIQDHPYQRRHLDMWTLLSVAAGRTERVRLLPDVANLPLRPPAVLAKAAASLDLLSGGRIDLGLGAGAFWDGIAALGGPRRSPGESVDALAEAIAVIRAMWSGERGASVAGEHYSLDGANPGPVPAHPIGIWLGAYKPRMLRLTGRAADGWLPSLGGNFLDPGDVPRLNASIDAAAEEAGRDPAQIERAVNVLDLPGLDGPDAPARVAELVTGLGFTTVILGPPGDADPAAFAQRLGGEIAPAVRELAG